MAGLREEKQRDRRQRIAKAALELFTRQGFEATTMEAIAEKARLGVGTLYNYYPSKADLMLGIIAERAGPYERDLKNLAEHPPERLFDALRACLETYLASFSFYGKRIWRDFAVTALSKGLPLFAMIQAVDEVFLTWLTALIGKYRKKSKVDDNPSAEIVARNVYSVLLHNIMVFISTEGMEIKELRESLARQLAAMFG
jgi:AcrR family transcriptional regulator